MWLQTAGRKERAEQGCTMSVEHCWVLRSWLFDFWWLPMRLNISFFIVTARLVRPFLASEVRFYFISKII